MQIRRNEQGQMLLIVVLTMIVALTVGLSIVSRTITNLRISRQGEESQRAFQAAEAGIQQALQIGGGANIDTPLSNNSSYTTTYKNVSGTAFFLNGGDPVDQDSGIDVWLSDYSADPARVFLNNAQTSPVTIVWGSGNTDCFSSSGTKVTPGLEIVMLTKNATNDLQNPKLTKLIYDPCGDTRIKGLNVITPLNTPSMVATTHIEDDADSVDFKYRAVVNFTPGDSGIIMKVLPLFASGKIGITSDVVLPVQGKTIVATGNSGQTARKIRYFTSYPQIPPEIFPYSIITQ